MRVTPPAGKRTEILLIYGHHTSLERIFGVAELLNKYSGITVPDLPGFGGMETFYKIGKQPTLDNMADYLAAFINKYLKNKRFVIAGYSLGFVVVTRLLQRHPNIIKKVDMVVSIAGLVHKDDFIFKRRTFLIFRYGTSFFSHYLPAAFLKYIAFRGPFIRTAYRLVENRHSKLVDGDRTERDKRIAFEIHLWQCNDPRTYMSMGKTMFTLDLTDRQIDLPVYHVSLDNDRYFNNKSVEKHMRQIYRDFYQFRADVPAHSPSVIASAEQASPYIPEQLRRLLKDIA